MVGERISPSVYKIVLTEIRCWITNCHFSLPGVRPVKMTGPNPHSPDQ